MCGLSRHQPAILATWEAGARQGLAQSQSEFKACLGSFEKVKDGWRCRLLVPNLTKHDFVIVGRCGEYFEYKFDGIKNYTGY